MNDKTNERKLVQAFRTFFQKSISPYVSTNQSVMNEWKHFNRIISSDPIDYTQIQFYNILQRPQTNNFSPLSPTSPQSEFRSTFSDMYKLNQASNLFLNSKPQGQSEKKIINSKTMISPKKYFLNQNRKNLVTILQNFQSQLLKNQQKLESFSRKQIGVNQTTISGSNKRPY